MTALQPGGNLDARDAAEWMQHARAGELDHAWRVSDRIRLRGPARRDATVPRHMQRIWDGTPLNGRRVLIRCYHGLGDTIQFIRYAPLVRAVATEVIVWAQPSLLDLLKRAPGIDRLLPLHDGQPEVAYDVDIEIMELPYAFRTTLATIPNRVPYLYAAPARLPDNEPRRIGVAWRSGDWNPGRSISFEQLQPLLETPEVSWYSLQVNLEPHEQHQALQQVDVQGVERTASMMSAFDLVISIDSMAAHLAGALGVPVWTLLPCDADWRWMMQRTDSPWYPTMRLFRQPRAGDWPSVLEAVRLALDGRR